MRKLLFIANPLSGGIDKKKLLEQVERTLRHPYEVAFTERPGHATELARKTDADIVVAMGGDGTVNEVASGLIGTHKVLVYADAAYVAECQHILVNTYHYQVALAHGDGLAETAVLASDQGAFVHLGTILFLVVILLLVLVLAAAHVGGATHLLPEAEGDTKGIADTKLGQILAHLFLFDHINNVQDFPPY